MTPTSDETIREQAKAIRTLEAKVAELEIERQRLDKGWEEANWTAFRNQTRAEEAESALKTLQAYADGLVRRALVAEKGTA